MSKIQIPTVCDLILTAFFPCHIPFCHASPTPRCVTSFMNVPAVPGSLQAYGLSPVWIRMWVFNRKGFENMLLQPGNGQACFVDLKVLANKLPPVNFVEIY